MFALTNTPATFRPWRAAAGRALGLARAFVLLEDWEVSSAPERAAPPAIAHPHRQPLRPPHRARRPGAGSPRPQLCVMPLRPEPTRHVTRTR
ncbi:MAG TPA: hypothetical protein VIL64_05900 [Solirubrobacteraceae bacterium]|jgi:hypothetical protein